MRRYRIVHMTDFIYDGPVFESYNEVRLRPRQDDAQSCISFRLVTEPTVRSTSHVDHSGNWVHRFNLLREHRRLRIEANSVVLVHDSQAPATAGIRLDELPDAGDELDEHYDLLAPTEYVPHTPALNELIQRAESRSKGTVDGFARAAAALIHGEFRYEKGATHVRSSIADAISTRAGVCQDFAHILLAVVRMRGIPGRYVSGYLVPSQAAEADASVEQIVGGQASHAWVEVFVPKAGWLALDPTLGKEVNHQHVRIAYGRDYGDVAPVRGVYKGHAGQQLCVDVRVRPALDIEGHEQLQETSAAPAQPASENAPQQQQQQQQQQ
jgi:transglutaminase-like putative cysteine protease